VPEIPEVYFDQFQISLGPWGAVMNFQLSSYQPPAPGGQQQSERVATARTSLQHLKALSFILVRHLKTFEQENQIDIQVPTRVLSAMTIAPEDWDSFWRRENA
jgi:hypothetical protein